MPQEEIKNISNVETTVISGSDIPMIVTNDLEAEIIQVKTERDEWKEKYNHLLQETELLRNPEIHKTVPVSIPVEKLPNSKDLAIHQKISTTYIQLPNATQGKEYEFLMDTNKLGLSELKFFQLIGLERCGLDFDDVTKMIKGVPTTNGDFQIKLRYKFTDINDDNPFLEKTITLIINPDPRSLWKNLPSDKTDKYWKADSEHISLNIEEKLIIVASHRGRSHAQEGKFRDDDFSIYHNEVSKWSFVIVADGAGSAQYARHGSLVACNQISDYFKNISKEQYQEFEAAIIEYGKNNTETTQKLNALIYKHLAGAALKAYKGIEQEAIIKEAKIKDYGTTIIFTLFKKYDFGWFVASFGIGDSPMGIYNIDQTPIITHYAEEGEYSGQTYFLTMPEILKDSKEIIKRISYKIIPDFTAMFLMTDGIYDPKFQTKNNLDKTALWKELWEDLNNQINFSKDNLEVSSQLLSWLDFWSAGNHDDRTIAIIC
jgi:serine/threonine protein phosphatase PrpC